MNNLYLSSKLIRNLNKSFTLKNHLSIKKNKMGFSYLFIVIIII